MAASKGKKTEKQKDFQKQKLKVGKARPKPANHTNTSFKAKRITLKQQSLAEDAPSYQAQFTHHVSLLSAASEIQKKESLNWLESAISTRDLTWSAPDLPDRLLPLLQDANGSVRSRLVKTLNVLPKDNLEFLAEKILLHVWAGMTSINLNIRVSALEVLDWAIDTCGIELVECPGGWFHTLKTYLIMLGWSTIGETSTGWSTNMAISGDIKNVVKALDTLTHFLRLGMLESTPPMGEVDQKADWWNSATKMHTRPDPYRSLNLYGRSTEDGSSATRDASHRRELFLNHFRSKFEAGIQEVKKQAGVAGRAAAKTSAVITEAMKEADIAQDMENQFMEKMEARTRRKREEIWKNGFTAVEA